MVKPDAAMQRREAAKSRSDGLSLGELDLAGKSRYTKGRSMKR
jgi:hypothetical protein